MHIIDSSSSTIFSYVMRWTKLNYPYYSDTHHWLSFYIDDGLLADSPNLQPEEPGILIQSSLFNQHPSPVNYGMKYPSPVMSLTNGTYYPPDLIWK